MEHDGLVAAAERVVYFGDVSLGTNRMAGLSVHWHAGSRQWLVDLPGCAGGPARAEVLRKFAEGALATLQSGSGGYEYTVFSDDYTNIELSTGFDDDGLYLTVWAWFDSRRDFAGVGRSGEPLYQSPVGAPYLELYVDPVDRAQLIGTLRTLLDRLAATGPGEPVPAAAPKVVATFSKPANSSSKTRLDIARRPGDGQWLISLYPRLTRPAPDAAIAGLAQATREILGARSGRRKVSLIVERSYRLDVTIAFEAARDAYSVDARVTSPGPGNTEYVLDLDARFEPVSAAQLRDMLAGLS